MANLMNLHWLADDEEGIMLPKNVTKGTIIKVTTKTGISIMISSSRISVATK
jgi:hypothetical protein